MATLSPMETVSGGQITTLIALRHGETRLNAEGVFQGQLDEPLNETGLAQARAVAKVIADLNPTRIVSSDLCRARQTAAEVAALTGLEVAIDPRLREIDCGSWSGRAFTEILAAEPWVGHQIRTGGDFRRSPEGETEAEVADRVGPALNELVEQTRGSVTVVAGHGLALRMGIARLLGFDQRASAALGTMLNCHFAKLLAQPGRIRLTGYNLGV